MAAFNTSAYKLLTYLFLLEFQKTQQCQNISPHTLDVYVDTSRPENDAEMAQDYCYHSSWKKNVMIFLEYTYISKRSFVENELHVDGCVMKAYMHGKIYILRSSIMVKSTRFEDVRSRVFFIVSVHNEMHKK